MKKTVIAAVIIFVLAFSLPVFAQSMTHNATYKLDGTIDLQKQVGHICNTGAEMKQTIEGEGEITKVMDTNQVAGKISVSDNNEWVTAPDAVNNLTVTSTIRLCAPAKHVYDDKNSDFDEMKIPHWWLYDAADPGVDTINPDGYVFDAGKFEPLTDQVWAVQVEADPGFSGGLTQNFDAAYGPYAGAADYWYGSFDDEPGEAWWYVDDEGNPVDPLVDGYHGIATGADYVGNFFNIDQMARTSQGTTRRYISISSPWSGAYLMEDMVVVGAAEIEESFEMDNIKAGADAIPDWWKLF